MKIREGLLTHPPSIPPTSFPVNNFFNYKGKRQNFIPLPVYPIPEGYNASETGPLITGYTPNGPLKWGPDQVGFSVFMQNDPGFGYCGTHDAYSYGYINNRAGDLLHSNIYKIDEPNEKRLYYDDNWVAWLNRPDVQTAVHAPKIEYRRCRGRLQQVAVTNEEVPPAYRLCPYLLSKGITVNIYGGDSTSSFQTWVPLSAFRT